ncbi:hypothetical protein PAHAL_5G283500 [Panicum hallii]|uniref:Uncharacterized protein n=1 Tax=Panicum hallii TaxID=206008 RepID=A0A2T8ILI5_9POAL|nr:hypothetical protein PAHAL_5G283500 [Panicum hallii]
MDRSKNQREGDDDDWEGRGAVDEGPRERRDWGATRAERRRCGRRHSVDADGRREAGDRRGTAPSYTRIGELGYLTTQSGSH